MKESSFGYIIILFLCHFNRLISATVVLKPLLFSFPDLPAKFAAGLHDSARCGALHLANPLDACSSLRNRFESNNTENVRFVLIERGQCSFEDKIRNAQIVGFRAAIVYDNRDMRNLIYMMMNPEGMNVSAVFVSKTAGEILRDHARGKEGECCIYLSYFGIETLWNVLAIPFFSLFVMISFLVMAFVVPRHWIHNLRIHRCVDLRMLEGFPRFAFHSTHLNLSHSGETRAICIEDYKDGEILKVLPCQHGGSLIRSVELKCSLNLNWISWYCCKSLNWTSNMAFLVHQWFHYCFFTDPRAQIINK